MKVLFITRKYPPQTGGMENYSYDLIRFAQVDKKVIALSKKQIHLIWFLPWALLKALFLIKQVDLVYLTDGLLGPIGLILKKMSGKPVLATVHGLDVTYPNWLYQKINVGSLKKLDKIIAISPETVEQCLQRGITREKITQIPDGIDCAKFYQPSLSREDLQKIVPFDLNNSKILLSVGRLVERKGTAWFIRHIMPQLKPKIRYLVVGAGPEEQAVRRAISEAGQEERVFLSGKISDQDLHVVYNTADLFIMPNIKVAGDMEGFGLVALEASAAGLPVIAADLEGIKEAITDQENGFLLQSGQVGSWIKKITSLLKDDQLRSEFGRRAREYTKENFDWQVIAQKYLHVFNEYTTN